jgi:DNA polymerase-3 subunit delta
VDEAEVLDSVANHSRFDVFALADAVLAGETARAFKILWGLRAEGVAPVLISWALNRDIGLLARLDYALRHGDNLDGALTRQGVWRRRQTLVKNALRRFKRRRLAALLTHGSRVDASLKGVFPAEPWGTLTELLIDMLKPPVEEAPVRTASAESI